MQHKARLFSARVAYYKIRRVLRVSHWWCIPRDDQMRCEMVDLGRILMRAIEI